MRHYTRLTSVRRFNLAAWQRRPARVHNNGQGYPDIVFKVGEPNMSLPDPFALAAPQLKPLNESMTELLTLSPNSAVPELLRFSESNLRSSRPCDNKVLFAAARHFFTLPGKRFRPTIAVLAASAANGGSIADPRQCRLAQIVEIVRTVRFWLLIATMP